MASTAYDIMDRAGLERWLRETAGDNSQRRERLKRNLSSRNWYIRFNASKSLERMGLTYLDLIDVMEGHDRYATEILRYRFDIRNLTQKEAEQECTS